MLVMIMFAMAGAVTAHSWCSTNKCPDYTRTISCNEARKQLVCECKSPFVVKRVSKTATSDTFQSCRCPFGTTKSPAGPLTDGSTCLNVPTGLICSKQTAFASAASGGGSCAATAYCATGFTITAGTGACKSSSILAVSVETGSPTWFSDCFIATVNTATNAVECTLKTAAQVGATDESWAEATVTGDTCLASVIAETSCERQSCIQLRR